MTDGHIAAIAGLVGVISQGIGPLFRYLAGARLAARKATLQEVAARQSELDSAYNRLERENLRMAREVADLRTALNVEREAHETTKAELERVQERCEQCERWMRMIGRRNDPPPLDPGA